MGKVRKRVRIIALLLLFMIGLGIFLYPIVANLYNDIHQGKAIDAYQKEVNGRTTEENDAMRQALVEYNETLLGGVGTQDPFVPADDPRAVNGVIDALQEKYGEAIGVLRIPSITLKTPIFLGVSEIQLQRGVGVLPGTSLPVGGIGTHSVITGHRGLPSAKLFSDLPEVKMSDVFYIDILGETLGYEVTSIKVIEPHQVSELMIVNNEDIVTLLTCTPYMINTHRLIVSGHRLPPSTRPTPKTENQEQGANDMLTFFLSNCCCILLLLVFILLIINTIITINVNSKVKKILAKGEKKTIHEKKSAHEKPVDRVDKAEKNE